MDRVASGQAEWQQPSTSPTEKSTGLGWTKYRQEEMDERLGIIRQALIHDSMAQHKVPEYGNAAKALAISYAYALESIPTHHLEESFRRATQANTGDFETTAGAVNKAYQEFIPELQARASANSAMQEYLLRSGKTGIDDLMGIAEFKQRHNLPATWEPGTTYPPESDLYRLDGVTGFAELHLYRCLRCKDSGWLCWAYDKVKNIGPTLMECSCGQAGKPWEGAS